MITLLAVIGVSLLLAIVFGGVAAVMDAGKQARAAALVALALLTGYIVTAGVWVVIQINAS